MSDMASNIIPGHAAQPASGVAVMRTIPHAERRPRLWPAVILVVLQWLCLTVPRWVAPGTIIQFYAMFFGPMLTAAAFTAWWLFFSRVHWRDRLLVLAVCVVLGAGAFFCFDPSLREFGLPGLTFFVIPVVATAWVLWLLVTPFLRWPTRRTGLLVVSLLAWGYFTLVRFAGANGTFESKFHFRWIPTAEDKLLAELAARQPTAEPTAIASIRLQPGDWPGFRGPNRDGSLTGVRIATDWTAHPPREVWRHRVGPGWSSFAVVGTRLYTQEQRGPDEMVVCYDTDTGTEVWAHKDSARFTEAIGGPGPRATPTFHDGKLYALGAAGRLNCLDPSTGRALWSRDVVADSGAKVPQWGFSASPLVAAGVVTVFAGGPEGKSVLGYNAVTGKPAWSAGDGQLSYCSTQLARLAGVEQVLIATEAGLTAFDPALGKVLWQHDWPVKDMARIVQPGVLDGSDVLIGTGMDHGTRRVRVGREGSDWTTQEIWTTRAIKPYYNDQVIHQGHLYGFDGPFLTCVSLDEGKGKWRARGYGNGQVLLLADQGLLLVLSEKGEAVLLEASPEAHKVLGRFQAIESKTWNHPVVAHGKLFVRNDEEMACYNLTEHAGQ
jgi:outer membrane protein assembly factor BamB